MKIACESCGTKYAIADDKVRGKVFKIRCKKCQNVIVVRGTEGEEGRTTPAPHEMSMTPAPQVESFLSAEVATAGGVSAGPEAIAAHAPPGGGAVWHVAIGGDQKGPFTAAEVKERSRRGEINGETFIWREGQADWKPLSDLPEFADVLHAQGRDRGAELFGKVDDGPASGELKIGQGVVSSEMPVSLGAGGGMFGEADTAGAAESPEMTGARHDTSVLFSLTNLTSMAGSGGGGGGGKAAAAAKPSATARTEGSGLIDIRKMAAGLSMQSGSTSDDIGAFSPTVAAPVLMPMMPSGPPKWLWPVVGLGVVIVLGMIGLIVVLATRKPETVMVQAPPPAVAPVAAAAAQPPTSPEPASGASATPPASPGPSVVATPEKTDRSPSRRTSSSSRAKRDEPSSPSPAPAPTTKPPAKKGGGDSLDDLLSGATRGGITSPKSGGGEAASDPTEALPETLSRSQIQTGMSAIRPRVQACYTQYRVPGTVNVDITISRAGAIQAARVTGKFAGTPTGSCVEKGVKAAKFPRFSGPPISITYPFVMQ